MISSGAMALEPAKLADFEIRGALGSGATAKVFEGVHVATGRPVALKMLSSAEGASPGAAERFAREAVLLSSFASRHVGKILGFGFDRGAPFLVLERLDGETLDAKLRRDGAVPFAAARDWVFELLVGVRDCHDARIIHRDIRPSNIFVSREGWQETIKLIDFGISRLRELAGVASDALTGEKHLLGSMAYMPPEQLRDPKTVGFGADLYAVGVVVFRMLTGRLPFVSRSPATVVRMKSELLPPPISSVVGMPGSPLLDGFVEKAMARDPRDRFQSAREMLGRWNEVIASLSDDATTQMKSRAHLEQLEQLEDEAAATMRRSALEEEPPTRTDPSLKELVAREVELHRRRKVEK